MEVLIDWYRAFAAVIAVVVVAFVVRQKVKKLPWPTGKWARLGAIVVALVAIGLVLM